MGKLAARYLGTYRWRTKNQSLSVTRKERPQKRIAGTRPAMPNESETIPSRRDLLSLIGAVAGSAAMYQAMTSLGFASEFTYNGPIRLEGDVKGASVLILGAGLAGMTAALELRAAGYKVQVLEFNSRPGGRNWTLRGGDSFTELGGATQTCDFEEGLYLNPGPWRIPYHHRALLDYCKRLGVALEPFIQLNHNALLHASKAFGGKPQRIRDIKADFQGQVSELLAKVTQQGKLDEAVSVEDKEILLQALQSWGALDKNYAYKANLISADFRGYARDPGGGLGAAPVAGEPIKLSDILKSQLWRISAEFCLASIPDHDVSAGRRHGHDRQGVRKGSRRSHSVRCEGDPDSAGRWRRHGQLCERQSDPSHAANGKGRLVRLHDSAFHPEPDPDRRRPAHEGGHRRRALCVLRQDRPAIQAPVLGGGRGDLRRHQLHRSADPADLLSEHRLQSQRPRRAAGRLCF